MSIEAFFSNFSPYVLAAYGAVVTFSAFLLNKLNTLAIRVAVLENEGENMRDRLVRMERKIDDILIRLSNKHGLE